MIRWFIAPAMILLSLVTIVVGVAMFWGPLREVLLAPVVIACGMGAGYCAIGVLEIALRRKW